MYQPRRSVLFVPSSNSRAVEKCSSLAVDTIILDLEDSVHPDQKSAARDSVKEILETVDFGYREVLVRINALDTDCWRDDVRMVGESKANGLVVPKVETVGEISRVRQSLGEYSELALWIMIESPKAVLAAEQLCGVQPPIAGVLMGTADLEKDLTCGRSPDRFPLQHALGHCILAARASGIVALDGVFMDVTDHEGFENEARQGNLLGFDGKTLIHPSQLEIANRIFSPDPDVIAEAGSLIQAWNEASQNGHGVCLYNGRLVESLHVKQAKALIAISDSIKSRSE